MPCGLVKPVTGGTRKFQGKLMPNATCQGEKPFGDEAAVNRKESGVQSPSQEPSGNKEGL